MSIHGLTFLDCVVKPCTKGIHLQSKMNAQVDFGNHTLMVEIQLFTLITKCSVIQSTLLM